MNIKIQQPQRPVRDEFKVDGGAESSVLLLKSLLPSVSSKAIYWWITRTQCLEAYICEAQILHWQYFKLLQNDHITACPLETNRFEDFHLLLSRQKIKIILGNLARHGFSLIKVFCLNKVKVWATTVRSSDKPASKTNVPKTAWSAPGTSPQRLLMLSCNLTDGKECSLVSINMLPYNFLYAFI